MKSSYSKIVKWIMLGLIIVSLGVFLYGWIAGFAENDAIAVDALFIWTYVMVGIALVSIVLIGGIIGIKNDKKFLVKVAAVLGSVAVICLAVYLISPGAPAVGIAEQPDGPKLKLTDTVLNLTYLCAGLAVVSIVVGEIVNAVRNGMKAK